MSHPDARPGAPARLYPLRRHPMGEAYSACSKRFIVVPAGRRSGKTERAKRKLIKRALRYDANPRGFFFAAAPTRDQAKTIYWDDLKAMCPREMISNISESTLTISMINGVDLRVLGMDVPARIEGSPWDGGVLDEFGNMKPIVFDAHVRPALADRKGWCDLIGVPEGRNHYYKLYRYAMDSGDPDWGAFTWKSIEVIDASEIAANRRSMDPLLFEQEFEASFVNFVGRAYYNFLADKHTGGLFYDDTRPIGFCFDFNVDPGVAAIVQEQVLPNGEWGTGVIGEVYIPKNSTTPAVCRKLIEDWSDHPSYVECYGDATGGARGTAKVQGSDWDLIKAALRPVFGDRVGFDNVPRANPAERARINSVNTRVFQGKLFVDPEAAPHVVTDLEGVRVLEGGSGEIDKKHDRELTHISDALGYYVVKEFPIDERIARASTFRM